MMRVALPFAVLEVGGSAAEVGLVIAARTVTLVATLLLGGVVADRVSSRRGLMVAADVERVVCHALMGALLIAGTAEVWMLAALAAATGLATGFFNPASTGLLPALVSTDDLQAANGLRSFSQFVGEVLGPAVAGILIVAFGTGWAVAIDAATFAASAVFLLALRVPARVREVEAGTMLEDLRAGWRTFRSITWVWVTVVGLSAGNLLWAAWSAIGPVIADRSLGGADAWGFVLAGTGVGGILGSLLAIGWRPHRPMLWVVITSAVFGVPLALLAAGASVGLLFAGTVVTGVALSFGNTVWESAMQRNVPAESISRVSAYDWFGSLAFYPVGLALWGPIGEAIGFSAALWIAFWGLAAIALAMFAVPQMRHMRD